MKNFLFVSAENDAINGCKAGGMGDVIRDVPRQISAKGDTVHVITIIFPIAFKSNIYYNITF